VTTARKLGIDVALPRRDDELVEAGHLVARERVVQQLDQWRPTHQRGRRTEARCSCSMITVRRGGAALPHQSFQPQRVDVVG
jgi:hypothetical protein